RDARFGPALELPPRRGVDEDVAAFRNSAPGQVPARRRVGGLAGPKDKTRCFLVGLDAEVAHRIEILGHRVLLRPGAVRVEVAEASAPQAPAPLRLLEVRRKRV